MDATAASRRSLLGSPLLLSAAPVATLQSLFAGLARAGEPTPPARELIARAGDAIDVFDFEALAETCHIPRQAAPLSLGPSLELLPLGAGEIELDAEGLPLLTLINTSRTRPSSSPRQVLAHQVRDVVRHTPGTSRATTCAPSSSA